MNRPRRGASLLELLVAMPLMLLLSAVVVQLFVSQLQLGSLVGRRAHNLQELEHAVSALAFDVRGAADVDLEAWTDSSLTLQAPVLAGIVCAVPSAQSIILLGSGAPHVLRSVAYTEPEVGDLISVRGGDSTLTGLPRSILDSTLHRARVQAVSRVASACGTSALHAAVGGAPYRISLATPLATPPDVGAAVHVTRKTEWRSYRSSDGRYYLGRRMWSAGGWTSTQPAAGPFLANRTGGFRLRLLHRGGYALSASPSGAVSPSGAAWLLVELRMARPQQRRQPPRHDSLLVRLALRGSP